MKYIKDIKNIKNSKDIKGTIKPINNPMKYKIIHTNIDIHDFTNTFISSCFNYYYGKIKLTNGNKSVKLGYSDSFINIKHAKQIFVIDFPNVIFKLYYKYNNFDIISRKFYTFIHKYITQKSNIYIISKPVVLNNTTYTITDFFNRGFELTKLQIPQHYFINENICVYDFAFRKSMHISSSSDDLIGLFISFIIFVYLLHNNIDPSKEMDNQHIKKLNIITNDAQYFDKNLFGKTSPEIKSHIDYFADVVCTKMHVSHNGPDNGYYYLLDNKIDGLLFENFLEEHYKANIKDTKYLECNLSILIELLLLQKDTSIKPRGFFKHNKHKINPNFTKRNFTKKNIPNFSYSNLDMLERKYLHQIQNTHNRPYIHNRTCKIRKTTTHDHLKNYYYLYAFIKYMQMYLHSKQEGKDIYGDFYGNYSTNSIIELFD
jgi:hypothetical protein